LENEYDAIRDKKAMLWYNSLAMAGLATLSVLSEVKDLYDEHGQLDMAIVHDKTGVSIKTLAGITAMTPQGLRNNPKSERVQRNGRRFVRILAELTRLLGARKDAMIWLREPHPELESHTPLELMAKGRFEPVEILVRRLGTGAPA